MNLPLGAADKSETVVPLKYLTVLVPLVIMSTAPFKSKLAADQSASVNPVAMSDHVPDTSFCNLVPTARINCVFPKLVRSRVVAPPDAP
ncbi:hypothetical protein D3C71_1912000 [compost metagenome]